MKTVRIALLTALALTAANTMRAADTSISITGTGGVIALIDQYNAAKAQAAADTAQKAAALQTLTALQSVYDQATAPGAARSYIPIFMEKTGFNTAGIAAKKAALEGQTPEEARLTIAEALKAAAARRKLEQVKAARAKIGDAARARLQQKEASAQLERQRAAARLQAAERRRKEQQAQAESAAKQKSGEALTAAARRALEERKRAEQRAAATKIEQAERRRQARQELEKRRKEKQEKDTAAAILQAAQRRKIALRRKFELCMQATTDEELANCVEILKAERNQLGQKLSKLRSQINVDAKSLQKQQAIQTATSLMGFAYKYTEQEREAAKQEALRLEAEIKKQQEESTAASQGIKRVQEQLTLATQAAKKPVRGEEKATGEDEKSSDDADAGRSAGGEESGEEGKSREEGEAGDEEEKAAALKAAQEKFDAAKEAVARIKHEEIQPIIDAVGKTTSLATKQQEIINSLKVINASENSTIDKQEISKILNGIADKEKQPSKPGLTTREISLKRILPELAKALNAQSAAQAALDALSAK